MMDTYEIYETLVFNSTFILLIVRNLSEYGLTVYPDKCQMSEVRNFHKLVCIDSMLAFHPDCPFGKHITVNPC
jgi:indole-3-glycerol phosphate synthase